MTTEPTPRTMPLYLDGKVVGYATQDENGDFNCVVTDRAAANLIHGGTPVNLSIDMNPNPQP